MTRIRLSSLLLLSLAACSSSSGTKTPDASTASAMITISGTTSEISISGTQALAAVNVQAFREGESTALASMTSDTSGNFTLSATTGGVAVDGYVLAKKDTYLDTYLYPPAPLAADFSGASVLMLTSSTRDLAGTVGQVSVDMTKAFIGLKVVDASGNPVMGATVSSTPAGTVRYNGTNGVPDKNATSTNADGVAYIFNPEPGQVMVSASKSGSTFHAHSINARASVITLTIVN